MKIAVLTSGGDSQGMNAAVRAVVRTTLYKGHESFVVYEGYKGLVENQIKKVDREFVSGILNRGGTILGSARLPEFATDQKIRDKAADNLKKLGIDGLVVIGGDGSYKGAMRLHELGIKVVGVPGTIDNDINSTDFTIGFDTAMNIATEAIDRIRDTSSSHRRCSVIEVMGRNCGDIALYSGIAGGAELIITSHSNISDEEIIKRVKAEMDGTKHSKNHVIVVITENLKDCWEFAKTIEKATGIVTRATQLGHVQRGGIPTAFDRVLASRLAAGAVLNILDGNSGNCMGIINQDIVATPIDKALKMERTDKDEDLIKLRGLLR